MIRRLLCWALGHGPYSRAWLSVLHEGEMRRARRCNCCGEYQLGQVDG